MPSAPTFLTPLYRGPGLEGESILEVQKKGESRATLEKGPKEKILKFVHERRS